MGSEGCFINQFLVAHTNHRTDEWGGSYKNRIRLALEVVARVREAVGPDFIIIYRLSLLDLIPDGSSWDEVVLLAKAIADAGATILNSGIGWHEARVPTIATSVPRAAFAWVTQKLRRQLHADGLRIPLVASNRINTPEVGEQVIADGCADMVSLARPFLADADFVNKARRGEADQINTCIACNQACLDHTFSNRISTCLVNPRACNELELVIHPARARKRYAVVGAGPAGLAAATTLAERGHQTGHRPGHPVGRASFGPLTLLVGSRQKLKGPDAQGAPFRHRSANSQAGCIATVLASWVAGMFAAGHAVQTEQHSERHEGGQAERSDSGAEVAAHGGFLLRLGRRYRCRWNEL